MTPTEYLQNCTDTELFETLIKIDLEINKRLINLFKKHNCTTVYVPEDEDMEVNVNNCFDMHNWEENSPFDKWVKISEIGYGTILDEDKTPINFVYVITKNGEQYSGDEVNENSMWDIYKTAKDILEK